MKRSNDERAEFIRTNLAKAFELIKPESGPLLTALLREDGSVTGCVNEMDSILREKWGSVYCKHHYGIEALGVKIFMELYERSIPSSPTVAERITAEMNRSRFKSVRKAEPQGWMGGRLVTLSSPRMFWNTLPASTTWLRQLVNGQKC